MDDTLETLGTIVWYNGWYDMLQKIKTHIQQEVETNKSKQYYNIGKPDFLIKIDCDLFPNTIWSILVLQCGDYGTSPRTGWIEIKKQKMLLKLLKHFVLKQKNIKVIIKVEICQK